MWSASILTKRRSPSLARVAQELLSQQEVQGRKTGKVVVGGAAEPQGNFPGGVVAGLQAFFGGPFQDCQQSVRPLFGAVPVEPQRGEVPAGIDFAKRRRGKPAGADAKAVGRQVILQRCRELLCRIFRG